MAVAQPEQRALHQHNARQLYLDIMWFGLLAGSAQAFLSVYMTRIGASGFQVGLLTAAPAAWPRPGVRRPTMRSRRSRSS